MRVSQTIAARCFLASLIGLLGIVCLGAAAGEVRQPIAIQFSLDRPINAGAAPFVMAAADGLFGSGGLTVTTDIAGGSPGGIARGVARATGFPVVGINELV